MSVGESLARARADRGLTVEDVAADTRIRSALIRGIEADDFALCGGDVYARGHIRSIARVLGIDGEPLVAEFDRDHHIVAPQVAVAAAMTPTDPDIAARADRRKPNWAAAMAIALVAICVLAVSGLVFGGGKHPSNSAADRPQPHTSVSDAPQASSPPRAATTLPVEQASMQVRTTNGQTWLQVKSKSGRVLFEGLLADGKAKLFTDKHGLEFVIGNTRAVDVTVNGHDIGSPHTATVVLRGRVVPGAHTVQGA